MPDDSGIQLQDVRSFTVRILKPDSDEVVGTGVAVTAQGGVITCSHVVKQALGVHPRDAGDATVTIWFPRLDKDKRRQTAKVSGVFADADDDVALLQVVGTLMLRPDQVAQLGSGASSKRHDFESYGYRRLDDFAGGWAHGVIQGPVEPPDNREFRAEPIQLRSDQINSGMSGAPVLDKKRNLVIGLVSDTWFPDTSGKDRDTAWAVDGQVLALAPFSLPLRDQPLPLLPAPTPRTDKDAAVAAVAADLGVRWNTAPEVPREWVGRGELIAQCVTDWADPAVGIVGLIGLGGEGKSTLARKIVETVLAQPTVPRPDGVFFWAFSERPNADEFFSALLDYMARGKIDPTKITSTAAKAQIVGAMLASGRYLFVLDGFEAMQHQDGDPCGEVTSHPLAELLGYVASRDHTSCALVTSRVELDLGKYTTYRQREVSRLTKKDGIDLLRALGCRGADDRLASLVETWNGHALTLHLIGSHLVATFGGDVDRADSLAAPSAVEHHYDRIARILQQNDEHLSDAERALLQLVCACRMPAPSALFGGISQEESADLPALQALVDLDEPRIGALIEHLSALRLLWQDESSGLLTTHALIRSRYRALLKAQSEVHAQVHLLLAVRHLNLTDFDLDAVMKPDYVPEIPALDELPPLERLLPGVEAVYHLCQAGRDELGIVVHSIWIARDVSNYLSSRYGAHETELDLCLNFFPERDLGQGPTRFRSYQNKIAMPLIALGRIPEAIDLLRRNTNSRIAEGDWANAAMNFPLLAECHYSLGDLAAAEAAMRDGLTYMDKTIEAGHKRADEVGFRRFSIEADLARIRSVRGQTDEASRLFEQAEKSAHAVDLPGLLSEAAVHFAEHCLRIGLPTVTLDLLERIRATSEAMGRRNDVLHCELVSARALAALNDPKAREELDEAVRNAEQWGDLTQVLSAQISRGTFAAKYGDGELARQDLSAALARAVELQFKLHEIDATIGLGWAWLSAGDRAQAKGAADRAIHMSEELGYQWGIDDAEPLRTASSE